MNSYEQSNDNRKETIVPKVNYKHEKRQRDIAKKKKHDEKLKRKQEKKNETPPSEKTEET